MARPLCPKEREEIYDTVRKADEAEELQHRRKEKLL
jgi:hypothetical protein